MIRNKSQQAEIKSGKQFNQEIDGGPRRGLRSRSSVARKKTWVLFKTTWETGHSGEKESSVVSNDCCRKRLSALQLKVSTDNWVLPGWSAHLICL